MNTGFDFNAVSPINAQVLAAWAADKAAYDKTNPKVPYPDPPAAILGSKTFIQPGGSRRTYQTDWTDVQPRFGLAWQFAARSVLRTGFGIFYKTATQSGYTDGFSQQTPYIASADAFTYNNPLTGPYSLQNPFPNGL